MSKPNNEKYIIVLKYFCSFIGLRFNLKKAFQQIDSVYEIIYLASKNGYLVHVAREKPVPVCFQSSAVQWEEGRE